MEQPLLEELQRKHPQQLTLMPLDVSGEENASAAAKVVALTLGNTLDVLEKS